jgi:adhesin/invasin
MASRSLSLGWCVTLSALVLGLTVGCGGEEPKPPVPPPEKELPDATKSTVEVSRNAGVVANGKEPVTITVTVRKADGAALADSTVTLEVSGDGNTLTPASGKTSAQGVLTATLTSTRPGSKQVTATVATDGAPVVLASRPTVEFVPLQVARLAFAATGIQATAGAPLSPAVEVRLQDSDGATVLGATGPVTLTLATGPASATLEGTLTVNAVDGVARFTEVRIKKAGTGYSLRASSGTLGAATSGTFDVVPADPRVLELTGLPASVTAGDSFSASVLLKDAFDNEATNYVGTLRFSSSDASAVLPADTTFTAADAGRKNFSALSLRRAGTQRVTVTDSANASVTASAEVQVSAGDAARLSFTQQPSNRSVRAPLGTIEVMFTDTYGNLTAVSSPPVTLALSPGGVTLNGTKTVSPVDGVASFTTLSINDEGNGYTLTATAGALTAATSASFNIIDNVAPAVPVLSQGATAPTSITVQWLAVGDDGTQGTALSQELRYSSSDIVTDADFAAATLVTTGAPKPAGGSESATLTGLTPGASYYVALKVTDNATNSVRSATLPVSTPNPAVTSLAFITQPVDGTAGSALPDIRVALRDANGDTVTSATSAVTLNLLNGPVFTPVTVLAVAGVATFSNITINTAGTGYAFQATSGSLPAVQSNTFSIQPGPAASLDMVGLVAPVISGQPGTVQVTAMDAYGNVATGYRGTVRFTSTDPAASLPADYAFIGTDNGRRMFTNQVVLRTAGARMVTVTDTGNGSLTDSISVTVDSGVAETLELTVPATPVSAGGNFDVVVTLRDGAGNLATGYRGTVTFSSTDSAAVLPPSYAFIDTDGGQKTFSGVQLRTAGTRSITARDQGNAALTDTEDVTVNPGAVAGLTLTGPASATAGSSFSVTVRAVDAHSNVVPSYTGTVQFSADDTQATLPGPYVFIGTDMGSRMFNVTLGTAGLQPVRVGDGTRNASINVTVNPGPATRLTLTGLANPVTAGIVEQFDVTAYDAFNNVATGYTGTVRTTSTDPAAPLPPDYTFSNANQGTASLPVELRTAGARDVTVVDIGNGALTATAGTVVQANSPAQLAFVQQPTSSTVRTTLSPVSVALRDAYGNPTNATSPTVTVSLSGGLGDATLTGTLNVSPVGGVATFSDLSIDQEGTGFQLTASAVGPAAVSTAFNIADTIAPDTAVITATRAGASGATIAWLAVGDDGNLGTAFAYDLRYASAPITNETQFGAATQVPIPAPQPPGTVESASVTGLDLSSDVFFALKVLDRPGNFSRSASVRVEGDLCSGVTCTPPASTCSADGTSRIEYTSACVPATGLCQNTPATTRCQAFETCSAGACVPVTPGSQAGAVIISEFSALGSEFIELHNTTGAGIDVAGYILRNAAGMMVDIRAVTDPNGTAGTPVTIPAGGYVYGVANPSGAIPAGPGFVFGEPGTAFALTDTGDALALYRKAPAGNLEDAVDFRTFNANPDTPVTDSHFIGFMGSSTQLEPTTLSAAGNDTATNWCVSFYAAGVRGSRITHTASALNGSCKVAIINEAFIDAAGGDDGATFIEIAGPGGAVIGGAKLTDVEGRGTQQGQLNAMATQTIPAGVRIPADGILLLADTIGITQNTAVPNVVDGVDVKIRTLDPENGGGDSIQLISADTPATLLDAVGYDTAGANLDTNTAVNGLGMYESATALYLAANGNGVASLSRLPGGVDSNNNRNDFRWDPSATPGLPNDAVSVSITSLTPNEVPRLVATTVVTVTGTDFGPGMTASFGGGGGPCTVEGPTLATCQATGRATAARVGVTLTNNAAVGVPPYTLAASFTYTDKYNETNDPLEMDYCNVQFPGSFSVETGQTTPVIYGRLYEAGITNPNGPPPGYIAQLGYGPAGSDPNATNTWRFFTATYNVQVGNDDEFQGSFVAPAAGSYSYVYRFSSDSGVRWTYCDVDGAGSDPGHDFQLAQMGTMTVTPTP